MNRKQLKQRLVRQGDTKVDVWLMLGVGWEDRGREIEPDR